MYNGHLIKQQMNSIFYLIAVTIFTQHLASWNVPGPSCFNVYQEHTLQQFANQWPSNIRIRMTRVKIMRCDKNISHKMNEAIMGVIGCLHTYNVNFPLKRFTNHLFFGFLYMYTSKIKPKHIGQTNNMSIYQTNTSLTMIMIW